MSLRENEETVMLISRLLYISRSKLDPARGAPAAQVRHIAAASSVRNAAVGLTGSLLFVDDHFVQVLEGEAEAVEATFERICCDFNHSEVRLIDMVSVKERLFAGWGMAVLSADEDTTIPIRADLQNIRFLVGINAREAVEQMRNFLVDNEEYAAQLA